MKKCISVLSIVLVLTLLVTSFTTTAVFAEETPATAITFSDGFDEVTTLEAGTLNYYVVEVNKPELTLTAQSSNETILKVKMTADSDNPGDYNLVVAAYKVGNATVTLTASDGTTVTQNLAVQEGSAERNYTISSDTTKDFALPKGNSYLMKIHYESYDVNNTYPLLVTDEDSPVLKIEQFSIDYDNNDYYYRIEAIGNDGETATLYMSGSHYIPEELCSVTIAENDFLRLDTTSTYVCNVYDSYSFIAYTNSATPPELNTVNGILFTEYVGKVDGGYEYRFESLDEGDDLILVSQNGETASFAVHVDDDVQPSVVSDAPQNITLEKGKSYTYKVSIMGGGEPTFVASTNGVVTVQKGKKDGINYYCQVTAIGENQSTTTLKVTFPNSGDPDYAVELGNITVTQQEMKSDTNADFSLKQGASYQFKITNATSFTAGTSGVFSITKVRTDGNDTYYKITAIGKPGQQAGFYMSVPGQAAKKVCVVTVAPSVTMKSDTNSNFSVKQGSSYQFKITGATGFYAGSSGVFNIQLVRKDGNDSYYRVTAIGKPGQQAGLYMSASGYAQKVCVVTVAEPDPITITSDTTYDFALSKNATYQFKLTAPGASTLNFCAGTSGVYSIALVKHTGNDFYYKITAIGQRGQETGLYASVPGQPAKKICKVSIK